MSTGVVLAQTNGASAGALTCSYCGWREKDPNWQSPLVHPFPFEAWCWRTRI